MTNVGDEVEAGPDNAIRVEMNPTTGEPRPLGPWPASPTVTAYAAADGWRAIAIADLRGVVNSKSAERENVLSYDGCDNIFARYVLLRARDTNAFAGDLIAAL